MAQGPRVRFAPSPTGYLHVGGARTALFNWLYARHHGGTFILRVEDTDKERSTEENTRAILDGMRWLGLDWDEGPEAGGAHAPYFQSQRGAIYRRYLDELLARGKAYRCFCTPAQLEAKRKAAEAEKRQYRYDRTCRDRQDQPDLPFVVRLRVPLDGVTAFDDAVYGHVEVKNETLQDWVLARADGSPLYNFCVVVDDLEMGVDLVMRGEDGLNNTQPQLTLYAALEKKPPRFAHLPFILGPDRSKLSKRHAAVSVQAYRDMGYLPQALVNYLARLGWSHGDQEIFTRDELVRHFDLDAVGNVAGVFNVDKLLWLNQHYLKTLSDDALGAQVAPLLKVENGPRLHAVLRPLRERSKTLVELAEGAKIFFTAGVALDESAAKKFLIGDNVPVLEFARAVVTDEPELTPPALEARFRAQAEKTGVGLGKIAQPVRVALTGSTQSPPLFDVIALLGRDEALRRLDAALARARA